MHGIKSSKPVRISEKRRQAASNTPAALVIVAALTALSAAALLWFWSQASLLYYGDAAAHINIARRIIDSRTPGWEQIGTVWLPLPHLLMLPLVRSDDLWKSGLAGGIVSSVAFVIAAAFLFAAARRAFSTAAAGAAAAFAFACNPNVLYLQSIPMTEMLFLASLAGTLYFSLTGHAAAAGLCVLAGTMTRYEAWILVPVVAAYLAFRLKRLVPVLLFIAIASSGAAWWLAHNLYYYGDPLEFYRGEWSAKAIYQRALDQGMARYPGDHDVGKAWMYYRSAAGAVAGIALVILGGLGIAVSLARRVVWPAVLLSVPVGFYVLSMYSSGTPIFVPHLWPHSYYNTRYGLAAIPLFAFGVSALAIRPWLAVALVAASMLPWVIYTEPSYWITWSESKVNSEARRAWTAEAAKFLKANYRDGDGVLASFGDLTAVFPEAGIPLKQVLHDGNGPYWLAAIARPDLFAKEKWALALSGDLVSDAIQKSRTEVYTRIHTINVSGAAPVTIYRHR